MKQAKECKGYVPYPFIIDRTHLHISIYPSITHVTSTLLISYTGQHPGSSAHSLTLKGESLELLEVRLAGKTLARSAYTLCNGNQEDSGSSSSEDDSDTDSDDDDDDDTQTLTIHKIPSGSFELQIRTAIHPELNQELQGLFVRHGIYATQCEAEGFGRISFHPNRPDVLSRWTVCLEADEAACPVLLSNGNLKEQGRLPGGRHYTVWENPWPKPCYLFSAVAGQLMCREGSHTITSSGKVIPIRIYTAPRYVHQLDYALLTIKAAMAWDEALWGREYDLDVYYMVGVEGFLDDGTETKGISIFDVGMMAAHPATHTDSEADEIQRLIAHEYYHNWSGNRVTLHDWHELTLKEGLTRFRDQAFAADMDAAAIAAAACITVSNGSYDGNGSNQADHLCQQPPLYANMYDRTLLHITTNQFSNWHLPHNSAPYAYNQAVPTTYPNRQYEQVLLHQLTAMALPKTGPAPMIAQAAAVPAGSAFPSSWRRVLEARDLRRDQFPEDDGPSSHAVRPERDTDLDNIYTDTVYNKGAEIVRMYHTILGPQEFYTGLQTFFSTHDGKAGRCEDFCYAMFKESSCRHLADAMMRWYDIPGTPELTVKAVYSPAKQALTLTIKQELESARKPLLIPLKIGLIGPDGKDLPLHLKTSPPTNAHHSSQDHHCLWCLGKASSNVHYTASSGHYISTQLAHPGLCESTSYSMVLLLDRWTNTFTFTRLPDKPAVSLLRDFSAPVKVHVDGETDKSLGFLALHDSNPFARWDAVQRLMTRALLRLYDVAENASGKSEAAVMAALSKAPGVPPALVTALQAALLNHQLDGQYKAAMLQLPSIDELVCDLDEPHPALVWKVRKHFCCQLAQQLLPQLQEVIDQCDKQLAGISATAGPQEVATAGFHPMAVKFRAARNSALEVLSSLDDIQIEQQFLNRCLGATCMTDCFACLKLIADSDTPARTIALQHFYNSYKDQPVALLKWLWAQASSNIKGNVRNVRALMQHGAFDITNPAAVKALLGGFCSSMVNFHANDGSGYKFLADAVIQVDKVSSFAAAELADHLFNWDGIEGDLARLLKQQLRRLAKTKGLSDAVLEVVEDAL